MPGLLRHRFRNQRLTGPGFASPAEVVAWLGAVQSQDYPGAKWSVGQRVVKGTDAMVEDAFNRGDILRTHLLRPPGISWPRPTSAGCSSSPHPTSIG